MEELWFRAGSGPRPVVWWRFSPALALMVFRLLTVRHIDAAFWVGVFLLAVAGLSLLSRHAARTHVGQEGIRVRRFFGAGRLIPWAQVRSVYLNEYRASQATKSIRVLRTNGRRPMLPGLVSTPTTPDPELVVKLAQITAWWELCTDAASRLAAPPPRRFRYRRSGLWQAGAAALVLVIPLTSTSAQLIDDLGSTDQSWVHYDITQVVPAVFLFLLLAVWSGALVRAWLLDRTVRFRWWVPLLALTMLPIAHVGSQASGANAPLGLEDYVPSLLTLVAALAVAAVVGVVRTRVAQGAAAAQASGPSPGDSW